MHVLIPKMIEWAMIPWLLLAGGAAYVMYYLLVACQPPKVYVKQGSNLKAFLINRLPILKEKYRPPFWAVNSHMQFFFQMRLPNLSHIPSIKFKSEVVSLPDGGEFGLNWADGPPSSGSAPSTIVLILPGTDCNLKAKYIQSATTITKEKCRSFSVVLTYRGRCGLKLKTPRITSWNDAEDLSFVIDLIKERYPNAALMAIGFSMGGLILGHYLVCQGKVANEKLKVAMLISTVLALLESSANWEKGFLTRVVNRAYTHTLTRLIKRNQDCFRGVISEEKMAEILACKYVEEFKASFMINQCGSESINHYYSEISLTGRLNRIKVPCLILQANDDMFQPGKDLPFAEVGECDNCAMILTKHGSHLTFMEGCLPFGYGYCDRMICQVVQEFGADAEMKTL